MRIDESQYLEHAGVKGMKWGQRKKRQLKIGTAGVTAGLIGRHYIANKKLPSATLAGSAAFTIAGALAAKAFLDRNGEITISTFRPSEG